MIARYNVASSTCFYSFHRASLFPVDSETMPSTLGFLALLLVPAYYFAATATSFVCLALRGFPAVVDATRIVEKFGSSISFVWSAVLATYYR